MSQDAASVGDALSPNEEYRRLTQKHTEYESRLSTLSDKVVLSAEEEVEEKTLKKRKLELKDRMEALARQLRQSPGQ